MKVIFIMFFKKLKLNFIDKGRLIQRVLRAPPRRDALGDAHDDE